MFLGSAGGRSKSTTRPSSQATESHHTASGLGHVTPCGELKDHYKLFGELETSSQGLA